MKFALTRIFHTHEEIINGKIRPPSGRSDFVTARPDEVGPTGRRFHTPEWEIFGLKWLVGLVMFAQILAVAGRAQGLEVVAVPDTLPAGQRKIFQERRAGLLEEWNGLRQKWTAYTSEFKGTKATDTLRVAQAAQRKAGLNAEAEHIGEEADDFMEAVTIAGHVESLTTQIDETEKQLHGLGFTQSAEDFEQIKAVSDEGMAQLKARLFSRLQDLVQEKPSAAMQARFLDAAKNLRPGQVRNMQTSLKELGAADPAFLEWLQSFRPNKSKTGLVADAKVVIHFLRQDKGLAKFFEDLDPDAVDAQQEAALTLLSLVMDHPYFNELRAVAAAGYDRSEAWFYVAAASMGAAELGTVTDNQLSNQKVLLTQIKDLIDERGMLRAELVKLLAPSSASDD
jgi:hypothetical protein